MTVDYLLPMSFVAICVVAIFCDLRHRRIPNQLILAGLAMPLPWLLLEGQALHGITIAASFAGALLGFACLLPAYALRTMGAGDVKFFALLGFWLGATPLVTVFVIGSLIAAVQALITLVSRHPLLHGHADTAGAIPQDSDHPRPHRGRFAGRGIPYASWLAIGALAWMLARPA